MEKTFVDMQWDIPADARTYEAAQLGVLMDIRRELKTLNLLLQCPNFQAIPFKLERIARNTTKPQRRRKARA